MARAASPLTKRRWWVAIWATLAGAALLARGLGSGPKTAGLAIGLAVSVLIGSVTVAVYNRGEARLRGEVGPAVWVHRCIDPADPRAWLFLVVSDDAVTVLDRRKDVRDRWPLADIADVTVGRVVMGVVDHTCLMMSLRDRRHPVPIALPSRSTLSYPPKLANEARGEIQRRLAEIHA